MDPNDVYAPLLKPLFGPGVLYDAGTKKRNQQFQHLAYSLRTARLKAYVPMIERETRTFLKSWGESVRKRERKASCLRWLRSLVPLSCFEVLVVSPPIFLPAAPFGRLASFED